MHMVSKRDLNSVELDTMRISKNPTAVMTANGELQTKEGATENVKHLDLFVTVILPEEIPAVSFPREALRGSWVYLPLDQRSKTTSHQKKDCDVSNIVPFVVPGLSMSSSTPSTSPTSSSQETVIGTEVPATRRRESARGSSSTRKLVV